MFFLQEEKDIGQQKNQSHLMQIRHMKPKLISNLNYEHDYFLRRKQKRKKRRSKIKQSSQVTETVRDQQSLKDQQELQCLQFCASRIEHQRGIYKSVYDGNDKVSGYWVNGLLHGDAQIQYSNGDYFKGKFQKGCKVYGKVTYKVQEASYQGDFYNQQFHGNGILRLMDKSISCEWVNGIPQGNCVMEYKTGTVYYGELKDFKKHGFGYIYYRNDTKFVGQFADGQIKGYGQYFENGQLKLKGIWKDGRLIQQKKDLDWQKMDKQQSINWLLFQSILNKGGNGQQNQAGKNLIIGGQDTLQKLNSTSSSQNKQINKKQETKNAPPYIFSFLSMFNKNKQAQNKQAINQQKSQVKVEQKSSPKIQKISQRKKRQQQQEISQVSQTQTESLTSQEILKQQS